MVPAFPITCASLCETVYDYLFLCYSDEYRYGIADVGSPSSALAGCRAQCECLQAVVPQCVDAFGHAFGACASRSSCDASDQCFEDAEIRVGATCPALDSAAESCSRTLDETKY
jgi:hypothetical protein